MTDSILVINPNSTEAVTRAMDAACAPLRMAGGPAIECVTLTEGPPGIETQRDVESVVAPLMRLVSAREQDHSAFVIACFSDPGLHVLRELTKKPVLGIAECSMLTALTLGQKFGVIAILQKSIARHASSFARSCGLNQGESRMLRRVGESAARRASAGVFTSNSSAPVST